VDPDVSPDVELAGLRDDGDLVERGRKQARELGRDGDSLVAALARRRASRPVVADELGPAGEILAQLQISARDPEVRVALAQPPLGERAEPPAGTLGPRRVRVSCLELEIPLQTV
jgi:hypothetical protein